MSSDVTMMIFGLIVGWALGLATAITWPRGKALPPFGGPPRIGGYQPRPGGRGQPTNLPQGTGAVRPLAGIEPSYYPPCPPPSARGTGAARAACHFPGHPEESERFLKTMEQWDATKEQRDDLAEIRRRLGGTEDEPVFMVVDRAAAQLKREGSKCPVT